MVSGRVREIRKRKGGKNVNDGERQEKKKELGLRQM